jgi:hypothetical protein
VHGPSVGGGIGWQAARGGSGGRGTGRGVHAWRRRKGGSKSSFQSLTQKRIKEKQKKRGSGGVLVCCYNSEFCYLQLIYIHVDLAFY